MKYLPLLPIAAFVFCGALAHAQTPAAEQGASPQEVSQSIQAFCASEWSTQAVIQQHCIDKQTEARTQALQFGSDPSADKARIWTQCRRDWTTRSGRLDWVMMARCVNFQVEAYKS